MGPRAIGVRNNLRESLGGIAIPGCPKVPDRIHLFTLGRKSQAEVHRGWIGERFSAAWSRVGRAMARRKRL
jgi:hypothetical protein